MKNRHFINMFAAVIVIAAWGLVSGTVYADTPQYVPDEIIVKFTKPVADILEKEHVQKKKPARQLKLNSSLDKLNKKYMVKNFTQIFKSFKKNRQKILSLNKKNKSQLTAKEIHLLKRLQRAPKNARIPDLDRIYKIDLEEGQSVEEAVSEYKQDPNVEYAEPNYIFSINNTEPNDPLYPLQWSLNNTGQDYPTSGRYNPAPGTTDSDSDVPEAWDIGTGSADVIVAVIDSGVDYNHRDLDDNMWINSAEIEGIPDFDDDGNGHVDDIYGYDFSTFGGKLRDSDPIDDNGHGTHCAGIIAAEGNNSLDITGVSWRTKIMAIKFLSREGYGELVDAVGSIYYAVENGADVTSNSWGGGPPSQTLEDAIDYAHSQGLVMIAAAGNNKSNAMSYPAAHNNMMAVIATDSNDKKASFSSYGDWTDVSAPGVDILSLRAAGTSLGAIYDKYTTIASGTSMACPQVSGLAALILSVNPDLSSDTVWQTIRESTDDLGDPGFDIFFGHGRINAERALLMTPSPNGKIFFGQAAYTAPSEAVILVSDRDLNSDPSLIEEVTVTVRSSSEEIFPETITLFEIGEDRGVFKGIIQLESEGVPEDSDGILHVQHNDSITASYNEESPPGIKEATASIDILGPVISEVYIKPNILIDGQVMADVSWMTDELSNSVVYYGTVPLSERGNILENPDFEDSLWPPISWSEWNGADTPNSGAYGYLTDTESHAGVYSVVRGLYGSGIRWGGYSQEVTVSPGESVISSGWLMSLTGENALRDGAEAYIELIFLDDSSNELAKYNSKSLTGASYWVKHQIIQSAPQDATRARLNFVLVANQSAASGEVYFDDALLGTNEQRDLTLVTDHKIVIKVLDIGTTYYFAVKSEDRLGNSTIDNNENGYYVLDEILPPEIELSTTVFDIETREQGEILTEILTIANTAPAGHVDLLFHFLEPVQDWISALPHSGEISAGYSTDLQIMIDTSQLIAGSYTGNIAIENNVSEPRIISVNILATPSASIRYVSHSIIDDWSERSYKVNGDTRLNPGEISELQVTLTNTGSLDAANLSATLLSNDPYITILDGAINIGNITSGATKITSDLFLIEASDNTPFGYSAMLEFVISDSQENQWSQPFQITVDERLNIQLSPSDVMINTDITGTAQSIEPNITCDNDGNVYSAWGDSRINTLYYLYSNSSRDYGRTWLENDMKISTQLSRTAQMYSKEGGHIYALWGRKYFHRSDNYGETWDETQINANNNATRSFPQMSFNDNGHMYAVWQQVTSFRYDVFFNYSIDDGQTWQTSDKKINTDVIQDYGERIQTHNLE